MFSPQIHVDTHQEHLIYLYFSWYKANYDNADELEWGRNLGCDFVKKSCFEWMATRQQRYSNQSFYKDYLMMCVNN